MSLPSKQAPKISRRIELLFTKFAAFYGHIWRSQFKDGEGFLLFVKKEWQEGLLEFSDEVLKKAILQSRRSHEMPPTLPQLILNCAEIRRQEQAFVKGPVITRGNIDIAKTYLRQCIDKLKHA